MTTFPHVIYTDGASKGNPGPSGAGYAIYGPELLCWGSKTLGKMTNNQAEYMAVTLALEQALQMGISLVHVKSDSLLVVNQMKGSYKVNGKLRAIHAEAQRWCARFDAVTFEHIPREENSIADKLASDACRSGGLGTCYP